MLKVGEDGSEALEIRSSGTEGPEETQRGALTILLGVLKCDHYKWSDESKDD